MQDPYNWPFPQRKDLMSLNPINKKDVGSAKPDKIAGSDCNLKISDIEGNSSKPCMKPYIYTNKPDYTNAIDDIAGTRSRVLIRKVCRDGYSLNNTDLKGAHPQTNEFVTKREPTNPVDPVYKLPTAVPVEPLIPKFIRDQISNDDIKGSKPNPPQAKLRKKVHIFDEVEGSKSKPAFLPRDHMEIMDVKDINEYRVFKSSRITNPLEPQYDLKDDEGKAIKYGFVDGSKSRILHPNHNVPQNNLMTQDLQGCFTGAISDHLLMRQTRKQFRQINDIKDVEGSQVGTLRKGFGHSRGTNPLNPQYQLPGRTEIYNNGLRIGTPHENAKRVDVEKPKTQQGPRSQSLMKLEMSTAQKLDQFISK